MQVFDNASIKTPLDTISKQALRDFGKAQKGSSKNMYLKKVTDDKGNESLKYAELKWGDYFANFFGSQKDFKLAEITEFLRSHPVSQNNMDDELKKGFKKFNEKIASHNSHFYIWAKIKPLSDQSAVIANKASDVVKRAIGTPLSSSVASSQRVPSYNWRDEKRNMNTVADRLHQKDSLGEEKKEKYSYISFTNPAYDVRYGEKDAEGGTWKLHISINPEQRDQAWGIIKESLNQTPLKIHGKVHSSKTADKNVQAGKEVCLMIEKGDKNPKQWNDFLSGLAHRLNAAGIIKDPRPMNSDPDQNKRKWDAAIPSTEKLPSYFNYRTDLFMCIDDNEWNGIIEGYTVIKRDDKKNPVAVAPPGGQGEGKMVKQSYFISLSEKVRHNPMGENDFLKELTIK